MFAIDHEDLGTPSPRTGAGAVTVEIDGKPVTVAEGTSIMRAAVHPSQIMEEIAQLTPTFTNVTYEKIDRMGSIQWPCNEAAPDGTPTMHVHQFVRGKGRFLATEYVPTTEKTTSRFP
jgi:hypothetical protein